MRITIQPTDKLDRIDKFLSQKLSLSRAFIQKQIKSGEITVNAEKVNAHYLPSIGDEIEIAKTEQEKPRILPNNDIALDIIDEANNYIVINKQSGLAAHPALGVMGTTLADVLVAEYPEISNVGDDALRPGIVHRLDRDVSGLMIVARTQKMFENLKKQFQERTVHKEYTALVHGIIKEENGMIDTPIGRSLTKDGKMAAHTQETENDREAKTEFEVLERIKNYTLLKIKIHTGRTHQIRVHLNSIGHPIVGDGLYANKRIKQPDLNRLFLHASKLKFDDLNGEHKEYESNLPKELKQFYESLK